MASTCGCTLALMDAGVPIKAPVAGAAMGLITDTATGRYAVLTDINGKEDAYGDMDFKVAGTAEGVTALQMDIKVARHHRCEIMRDALEQARVARLFILDKMTAVISASRERAVAVRAAHHDHQDPGRQDPRRHRRRAAR